MTTRHSSGPRSTIAIVLVLSATGTALAAPGIQAVYTEYSPAGAPLSINIVGSGFTCPDCPTPKVQLGGLPLKIKAHSARVITALLPQPIPGGDYSLEVTSGPVQRAEVARFSLSIAPVPVAAGGVVTRPAFRATTGAASQPPPPDRLRATLNPPTRPAGTSSRSGSAASKVSGVVGTGTVATPLIDAASTADPVVTALPPYNTGYGEYALFDLSRGYNNGTRGNSAFGYGALMKTTAGSYNNAFGWWALAYNDVGGANNAFGNFALYSNTTGSSNNAFGQEALYSNTTGLDNAAFGLQALYSNTTGEANSAFGHHALQLNTTGSLNSAVGVSALRSNTTGSHNNALGYNALYSNTTGSQNNAFGENALRSNTVGTANSAFGHFALESNVSSSSNSAFGNSALASHYGGASPGKNSAFGAGALASDQIGTNNSAFGFNAMGASSGSNNNLNSAFGVEALYGNVGGWNSAFGYAALRDNWDGAYNSAFGNEALRHNTRGRFNTAFGHDSLTANTTANYSTAIGSHALHENSTGGANTAIGSDTLHSLIDGYNNLALGSSAGSDIVNGDNNIYIEHPGVSESAHIRIGDPTVHTGGTFIAGIRTATVTGSAVLVSVSGQLGVSSSSRRHKDDIAPIGEASRRIYDLRPVSFRYKEPTEGGERPVQFGLVAEEVAAVLPELVINDAHGQPETVAYHVLPTLLLNELQEQRAELQRAHVTIQAQAEQIAWMQARLTEVDALRAKVDGLQELTAQLVVLAGVDPAGHGRATRASAIAGPRPAALGQPPAPIVFAAPRADDTSQ